MAATYILQTYTHAMEAKKETQLTRCWPYSFDQTPQAMRDLCLIVYRQRCNEELFTLGEYAKARNDSPLALSYYQEAWWGENVNAAFFAAKMYYVGDGCNKNLSVAIDWAKAAGGKDHAEANYWLGLRHKVKSDTRVYTWQEEETYQEQVGVEVKETSHRHGPRHTTEEVPIYETRTRMVTKEKKYATFYSEVTQEENCFNGYDGRCERFQKHMDSRIKSAKFFRAAADAGQARAAFEYSILLRGEDVFARMILAEERPHLSWFVRLFRDETPLTAEQKAADESRQQNLAIIQRDEKIYFERAKNAGIASSEVADSYSDSTCCIQ